MSKKVYVEVLVKFNQDGNMLPIRITWPNGRVFDIDKLLDVRPASAKSGGCGIRYLCRILDREVPLYYGADNSGKVDLWWCDGKD